MKEGRMKEREGGRKDKKKIPERKCEKNVIKSLKRKTRSKKNDGN